MRINARLKDRVLMRYNNETFLPVGDNSDYIIHFDIADSDRKTAMFAKFVRSGREQEISLDEDGNANIPLWVLKEGYFKVGLTADGFASTPLTVGVRESINNEKLTQTQDPEPEKIDMLIALVNGIKQVGIQSAEVNADGHLIFTLTDGTILDAGDVCIRVQSDYEQSDSTQPDYIKNRTHYKEIIHQEKVDLLPSTEISDSLAGEMSYSQPEPLNIQVGDTVKVLWDNQEYECVAQSFATLDPSVWTGLPADCIAFGNFYYAFEVDPDSQNIPFLVMANYTMSEQEGFISGCTIMPTSELTNPITVNIFTGGDKVVYHTLDNKYLNLDNEVRQDSNNPVTAKAVYKAVDEAEPEALTNFEIEELLKNFV